MSVDRTELIEKLQAENRSLRDRLGYDNACNEAKVAEAPGLYQGQIGGALKAISPDENIDFIFTFHDDPDKTPHYVEIREAAKAFAKVLTRHTPRCADQTAAIRKVREAMMTANAAVALSGRV